MARYKFLHLEYAKCGTPVAILEKLEDHSYEHWDLPSLRTRIKNLRNYHENYDVEEEARDAILAAMTHDKPDQETKTRTVRDQLADLIADHKLGGTGMSYRVEVIFPNRYEYDDKCDALQKISEFVRDSIMEGSFPTWKVTVSRSVDLDKEIS